MLLEESQDSNLLLEVTKESIKRSTKWILLETIFNVLKLFIYDELVAIVDPKFTKFYKFI